MRDELRQNNLSAFGEMLHENWELKRSLANDISSSQIDSWYEAARREGAVGGKLLGAGTGGFLLFYVPVERQAAVVQALSGLRQVAMRFEPQGSKIIFVHD